MLPLLIGIATGFVAILFVNVLGKSAKDVMYGLVLAGIGFIYIGFTWTDVTQLTITCVQAVIFLALAFYGIKKNINILIAGYFLHGIWDLLYNYATSVPLAPPHYDVFCLAADVTIGAYIVVEKKRLSATII